MESDGRFCFSIDRGGTFTDVYAIIPASPGFRVLKLLSEDPDNYDDAPREGIRRILEEVTGVAHPPTRPLDTSRIEWVRMGTTVATNALLERKGERVALAITKGFRDLLEIGNQARPAIFDLEIRKPGVLYETVVEVDERVCVEHQDAPALGGKEANVVSGVTGDRVIILRAPNYDAIHRDLQKVYDTGVRSLAVALIHAFTFPSHEQEVARIAFEIGFTQVSCSSEDTAMVRIVPRGQTATVDAYLTPHIQRYINGFASGFKDNLKGVKVLFMQSDGGLTPADRFTGYRAILSGPAGGVVGYSLVTFNDVTQKPVIGFDMGGTSTDVSRYAGRYEHIFETQTAGVSIQAPQLDINTVAAGGGSRLFFRDGLFVVGPESVGAHPGPVCYRKGGYLAITDANLVLGRILPDYFPKIFGPNGNEALDIAATRAAFSVLTEEINQWFQKNAPQVSHKPMTVEEVALGFIRVANETMCRPIRAISQMKGYDTTKHVLACFGAAGPQHACAIARELGIREVFVHRFSGILSAYGIGLADVVHESQEPSSMDYTHDAIDTFDAILCTLRQKTFDELARQGFAPHQITTEDFLNLRYEGTDTSVMTPRPHNSDFLKAFVDNYQREFGFTLPSRRVVVDDFRVRGVGRGQTLDRHKIPPQHGLLHADTIVRCVFQTGATDTPVFLLDHLGAGCTIEGPAIIMNATSTIVVEPDCCVTITEEGDVHISVRQETPPMLGLKMDPVQLSIFAHRFMSIAEQMGRTLQRTAISTNIKERLDFSCALFGPDGHLVANAPHIPVHLGAMSEAIKSQLRRLQGEIHDGDVIVTNHPSTGGSHLPDITVITPVFRGGNIVFFVANRGHHADIGGLNPGSMPPFSKSLVEEGACIQSFKLVAGGVFQEDGITELLMRPGTVKREAHEPLLSGTRNLRDNLSDLKAQVAANKNGIHLVTDLIDYYGLEVVQAYMKHVQNAAELCVRQMLKELSVNRGLKEKDTIHAVDFMDDGSPIELSLTIDRKDCTAHFDFTGTGPEVYGNWNAPRAVTTSAILYCLRCLVDKDIPLNEGCLKPVSITLPDGTLLSPSEDAAVVGGNVLTSQRITDVILTAFGACACSQGCMNNLTFGDDTMGYYETLGGGSGAGPTWHGASGVHVHMSNTRITDPEILERRYPVLLREFCIRRHSGGKGLFHGGDGLIRDIEFLKPFTVTVLSERRVLAPAGMNAGEAGRPGENRFITRDGRTKNLGGKNIFHAQPGDRLRIATPGGGGWGALAGPSESMGQ